jgi:hypothetical protein
MEYGGGDGENRKDKFLVGESKFHGNQSGLRDVLLGRNNPRQRHGTIADNKVTIACGWPLT